MKTTENLQLTSATVESAMKKQKPFLMYQIVSPVTIEGHTCNGYWNTTVKRVCFEEMIVAVFKVKPLLNN